MPDFIKNRFSIAYTFVGYYLLASALLRVFFLYLSGTFVDPSLLGWVKVFAVGALFDFGASIFLIAPYLLFLLVNPKFFIGTLFDRILIYFILALTFVITLFSFMGEIPFWEEFNTRYNFIAVDYLIYTFEVVENINQSYPLPILISGLLMLCTLLFVGLIRTKRFHHTFSDRMSFLGRGIRIVPFLLIGLIYGFYVKNDHAEYSSNTYVNELSKNGVYSFFAAYRSNELDFNSFYATLDKEHSFGIIRKELLQPNQTYLSDSIHSILRESCSTKEEIVPNIVLICLESFNAGFMGTFGNSRGLTPNLDQLASESILFTNMYATGTRTVRGMEALTLSVPPTPGNSIIRRPNNGQLYSIGTIFKQKEYDLNFFYGGDGYFDNMNSFFGGQGFVIIDRNRGNPLSEKIRTKRINISDDEVSFENAWGICDEDIYNKLIKLSDDNFSQGKRSFSFVMTTSNHRPYTFPDNKIDLAQGSREAAVKYTDFALGEFFKKAKTKPWFENTVFVVVADHCASSAGKWDITIDKHHIPAFVYNLPNRNRQTVEKLVSQIDIMPTLFGYLNWSYNTSLYGLDISLMSKSDERALIGNYRTVGLLKADIFTEINDHKKVNQYSWNSSQTIMTPLEQQIKDLKNLTISYYQTASYRFKHGLMKEGSEVLQ